MPKYLVEMHDGRKFQVEADSQPSETDILSHLGAQQAKQPDPVSALDMASGKVGRDPGSSDGPAAPDWKANLATAMEPAAHPQTVSDFGGLVLAPVDATRGAAGMAGNALKAAAPYAGRALTASGGALSRGGSALQSSEVPLGGVGYLLGGKEGAAIGAGIPRVMQGAGKLLTKVGGAITPEAPIVPVPTGPHMDLSTPIQAGKLTPQQIGERIQAVNASGGLPQQPIVAPKSPLGGRLPMSAEPLQPIGQQRPPITVSPASPMQPPTPESGLQQPRASVGAEVVGRHNGMTTQQVRDTTGPIRGEAQGAAAGMPSKPMDRIVQKLIDMGPKGQGLPESAREGYAAAATSDKARLQIQAYLDALRKVGFVGAGAAAPSLMRNQLVSGIQDQQ